MPLPLSLAGGSFSSGGCHAPHSHGVSSERVAWELRTYQLRLGYDAVPQFLELYADGLEVLRPARDYKNRHASILLTLEALVEAMEEVQKFFPERFGDGPEGRF